MSRRLLLAALAAAAVLPFALACSDATGPQPGPQVRLTVESTSGPTYRNAEDGLLQVVCEVTFRADLTGGRSVRWLDGTAVMTLGAGEFAVVDSFAVSADQIASGWGADTLAAGQPRTTTWTFWADVPYELAFDIRYRAAGGDVLTTTLPLSCRPAISANAAPPAITSLSVEPIPGANGVLEPGDSVAVNVSATSSVGLWRIAVGLDEACEANVQLSERVTPSASRTVRFALPRTCRLDAPLLAWAAVFDVALARATAGTVVAERLRDVTSPTVAPTFTPNSATGVTPALRGTTFEDEFLFILPNATDNHEVRWVHWEVLPAGIRDSAPVAPTGQSGPQPVSVQVTRAWVGDDVRMRVWARDASGNESARFETAGGLRVVPNIETRTGASIVPTAVRDFVVDSRRGRAYLLEESPRRVAVLDLASATVTGHLTVPTDAVAFDLTLGGDSLVLLTATPPQTLSFVDLRDPAAAPAPIVLDTAGTGYQRGVGAVRVTANGSALVAYSVLSSQATITLAVQRVDLHTGAQRWLGNVQSPLGASLPTLERSADGRAVILSSYVGYAQRYDASADSFGAPAPATTFWTSTGRAPVPSNAGALSAVGGHVFGPDWAPTLRAPSAVATPAREGVAFAPDDASFYFSVAGPFAGRVIRASTADAAPLGSWRPTAAPARIRVASDGTLVMLTWTLECAPPACTRVEVVRLP